MSKSVKNLTEKMQKLRVKFDRVAYRKAYDAVYFRKVAVCPRCGQLKTKHMLGRHMKTKKCERLAAARLQQK